KWHLGDNFPCRPQDQGFQEVLIHGGGGVTQTPDYWGNDYFGDTYWHNGKPTKFEEYCTDVWFDGAMRFIEQNKNKPFLAYIPTNAAHGPFLVAEKYSKPYKDMGIPSPRAEFYGMITNLDENLGRLDQKLAELNLTDNTILIFTTDNGTAAGTRGGGFNAGMRGQKGSEYDGGHRVPFFVRWPGGKITGGRDVNQITAHIDVLPTLAELCDVPLPKSLKIDGQSLVPLLKGDLAESWPNRTLAVHSQRLETPKKWRKAAVMTDRWRLVTDGKRRELFDMNTDPGQKTNVAKDHPEVFERLSGDYEKWYKSISTRFDDYVRVGIGNEAENPVHLTCHDWHTDDGLVPWNQPSVQRHPKANGFWAVDVTKEGEYEITLRLRPHYVKDAVPLKADSASVNFDWEDSKLDVKYPAAQTNHTLGEDQSSVSFKCHLPKG
ncbi:MAG: arylsulfatase, partial [Planctomycetaceae bacterium]|nr:arylsulfatase [Planctomycetaceae bacterium]